MQVIIKSPPPALSAANNTVVKPGWTGEWLAKGVLAAPIHSGSGKPGGSSRAMETRLQGRMCHLTQRAGEGCKAWQLVPLGGTRVPACP